MAPQICNHTLALASYHLLFPLPSRARRRISVQEALEHPYLATLHDPAVEPVAPAPFVFDFEEEDLKEAQLRRGIVPIHRSMLFHSDVRLEEIARSCRVS